MICNGTNINTAYSASILDIAESGYDIKNNYLQTKGSLNFILLNAPDVPLKALKISFEIEGTDPANISEKISSLTGLFYGKKLSISDLGDGYIWDSVLIKTGDIKEIAPFLQQVSYTFIGVKKGTPVTFTTTQNSYTKNILGTYQTDPVITITNTSGNITVMGVTINNIPSGATTVIDCAAKTIKTNGTNKMNDCVLTEFPKLYPGNNTITKNKTATLSITYSPIYL